MCIYIYRKQIIELLDLYIIIMNTNYSLTNMFKSSKLFNEKDKVILIILNLNYKSLYH